MKHGSGRIKMSFTLPIMHEICTLTVKHNKNNKDKIEFTKSRVLWSHTVCLKESCLRLFDVNQCMKDRSNWPGVTLKFALFNHVFHVRCIKKCSLVVYNFLPLLHPTHFLTEAYKTIFCPYIRLKISHRTLLLAVRDITEDRDRMGGKAQTVVVLIPS